jgi:hypothetical protein
MGLRFIDLDRKTEAIIKELVRKLEKGKRGT